jgi:hypothetical protein
MISEETLGHAQFLPLWVGPGPWLKGEVIVYCSTSLFPFHMRQFPVETFLFGVQLK